MLGSVFLCVLDSTNASSEFVSVQKSNLSLILTAKSGPGVYLMLYLLSCTVHQGNIFDK